MKLQPEEPPPILGTWRRVYTAVVLFLIADLVLFYLFTKTFNAPQ